MVGPVEPVEAFRGVAVTVTEQFEVAAAVVYVVPFKVPPQPVTEAMP